MLAGVPPRTRIGSAVEPVEQTGELAIPRPVEVGREHLDGTERVRNAADDGELMNGLHRRPTLATAAMRMGSARVRVHALVI